MEKDLRSGLKKISENNSKRVYQDRIIPFDLEFLNENENEINCHNIFLNYLNIKSMQSSHISMSQCIRPIANQAFELKLMEGTNDNKKIDFPWNCR